MVSRIILLLSISWIVRLAVGMVDAVVVMVIAVIVAAGVMLAAAGPISEFVQRHPTVKMLALSFLLLIGVTLLVEGFDQHIPKGYIYFAMGFAVFVELLNLRVRKHSEPVHIHQPSLPEGRAGVERLAPVATD